MAEFTVPEKCKRAKLNPGPDDPEHRIVVIPSDGFDNSPSEEYDSIQKKGIPLILCSYCDADTVAAAIRAHDKGLSS